MKNEKVKKVKKVEKVEKVNEISYPDLENMGLVKETRDPSPYNLYEEWYIDKGGRRQGACTSFFSDMSICSREYYRDGRLDGDSFTYYASGELRSQAFWKEGRIQGYHTEYRKDGTILKAEDYYPGGDPRRVMKYDEKGKIIEITQYYYKRNVGRTKSVTQFKEGKKVRYARYDPFGKVEYEETFV